MSVAHSEYREAIAYALDSINKRTVDRAVKTALFGPTPEHSFKVNPHGFTEIDERSFIAETAKLNTADFWHQIVKGMGFRPQLATRAWFLTNHHVWKMRDISRATSKISDGFYGGAVALMATAALLGEGFSSSTFVSHEILSAARLAGADFGTRAETPEEVLERLRLLYPVQIGNDSRSAFSYLAKRHSMQSAIHSDYGGTNYNTCPGIGLTRDIFESYGEMLRNPGYSQLFLNNIRTSANP
jgi:hypothetical protein